jgi:hypothetical protein
LTIKGNYLTGKRRIIAVVTALSAGLGLTVVPLASAYSVPGPPGTPGGQPTDATGGSSASQSETHTAATALAGYTALELSKLSPKVTLPSSVGTSARAIRPIGADSATRALSYKKVSCAVNVRKSEIGSGSARNGARSFRIHFTKHGRQYLRQHNSTPTTLTVKCTFVPKHGKKSMSSSKVVLSA